MVCPGYWSARHSSKLDSVERIFSIAETLVRRLPPPWERSRRGRRPKFTARKHAAVCATARYFDYTYREVEGQARLIMTKTIDHSTVGWALKRMRVPYLKLLLLLLFREINRLAKCQTYMVDSTGISTTRLSRRKRVLKTSWSREFLKMHVLVGYSPQAGALAIASARVTAGNVADCTQLDRLLEGIQGMGEPLLGDRGYDSQLNIDTAARHGFRAVIKPRAIGMHHRVRKKRFKEFRRDRRLYRQRGIAEAVFGGIENRYGAMVRCRLPVTKAASVLLMAVAHNLRTLARVRAMKEMGYSLFVWIYSTNSFLPNQVRGCILSGCLLPHPCD